MADILGDDELRMTRIGALFGSVNETAIFVGPALGGLLVALSGAPAVLGVDAVSFLVACALIGAFVPRRAPAAGGAPRGRGARRPPLVVGGTGRCACA